MLSAPSLKSVGSTWTFCDAEIPRRGATSEALSCERPAYVAALEAPGVDLIQTMHDTKARNRMAFVVVDIRSLAH